MEQKPKCNKIAAIVLFAVLLALFCLSPMIPDTGRWGILYFVVVIAIAIPLGIILSGPLTAFIVKYWK